MSERKLHILLLLVLTILVVGTAISHLKLEQCHRFSYAPQMEQAAELSQRWMSHIDSMKRTLGIESDLHTNVANRSMIGEDFTSMTSTLGSLAAKEISTNPEFAALMVRLLKEAGMEPGDTAGVFASGSFPALTVSSLAALQTLGIEVILTPSLGASTFGANQPLATWADMESWLSNVGMKFHSEFITRGGENDNGGGLMEEGVALIDEAVQRNNQQLFVPENLAESIQKRNLLYRSQSIKVLVNIGGNQSALGGCAHSSTLPNGLVENLHVCDDPNRGLLQDFGAMGTPVINLLDIRNLASNYGMDILPGKRYKKARHLYSVCKLSLFAKVTIITTLLFAFLLTVRIAILNKVSNPFRTKK